ncbi:MAG: FliM/FliN family flagellar motor switch protein, partial [Rhodospirillales bacterium]|nr:FliM/FliN family flagellar motor switch protein [Rhodospirillales bacterium]
THLAENLWLTDVELTAVLDEQTLPLREIFALKVGSRLMFDATPDSLIEMRCADVPMYAARMGRSGERIAVQIDGRAAQRLNPKAPRRGL